MKNLFAVFFGAAFLVMSGCTQREVSQEGYPSRDAYASETQRDQWTDRLRSESTTPCRITYHPMGHLAGLAGSFPLTSSSPTDVVGWFQAHAEILGIALDAELTLVKEEPFYEVDVRSMHRNVGTEESPRGPFYEFSGEWLDEQVGTIYSFEVIHQGYPFVGMYLSGIVSSDQPILRGVYNGFSPAIKGFAAMTASPEDLAWQAAEKHIGSPLTRLSSVQTWFDLSWSINRIPSTKELHWRLQGLDDSELLRYIFVRSIDNKVVYATPNTTSFGYEVHQIHQNDAGDTLWDSINLPNGCSPGMSGCSGPALDESKKSRDILPRTVDLWYGLSSPGNPPFVWPFSGMHKSPLDNRGRRVWAIVAHASSEPYPYKIGNTYYFQRGTLSQKFYGINGVYELFTADFAGHEYGHVILQELKSVHPGQRPGLKSPPATFTEAMCDFIGIVTQDSLHNQDIDTYPPYGKFYGNSDFQIGETQWTSDGKFIDYAFVSWPHKQGDLVGRGRERIGHAFYNTWVWIESWYGNRPRSVRSANFRAWWIDIMRSFALVSDFPDIIDFYAATESRLGTYALMEAGVSFRLALELEKLGLQNGCY